jgi:hypothetical protein
LPVGGISVTSGTPSASTFLRGDSTWAPIVLTVGTTAISGATNGYLLYNNGGTLGSVAPTAASLSIGSPITGGTSGYGLYVDASTQLGQFAYGTGVRTALGNATNAASGLVTYSGSFGTPSSINLTNAALLSLPVGSISATGTANNTTYLRGDGVWASVGSGGVTVNTGVTNQLSYYSGASAISGNDKATISGGALTLGVQSTTAGSIVLANTNVAARSTTIQSSASASAAWTLTLPVSAGSSTNVLSTDGTGVTSWVAASVGTVTSVGLTVATGAGGILSNSGSTSPITGSGTYTLAVSGNSGGIPYFSSPSAWASSGTLTANGVVYGGGSGASPASTAVGTTGQVLIATTSNAPSWGQVPLATGVTGSLPIGNGGTGQATTALGTIVVGASGSTTTNLAIGTTSQVLTVVGGTAAWATPASGGVSTITFGSTGLTPATATSGAVTVAGTLAVANGGTGLTTTPANGALDIGNGTGFTRTTLTAGTNITITNGAGSISIAASGGGGFSSLTAFTTAGITTFTVPAGITKVKVTVVGGGGAGGGATSGCSDGIGAGGAGGGAAIKIVSGLTPGGTVSVTVGAGGTAVSGGTGNTGGTSSFGAYCSATGGVGGGAGAAGTGTPNVGGIGSSGDLNCSGGPGFIGNSNLSGSGGYTILGGGARGITSNSASGTIGGTYGGGGSGGKTNGGAVSGGAGGVGTVIVEY